MYKAIKPDNVIFKSQEFQKDKYKFNQILIPQPAKNEAAVKVKIIT